MPRSVDASTPAPARSSSRARKTTGAAAAPQDTDAKTVGRGSVRVGDAIRIERRYVVDGSLTSVTDDGRFKGVELVGTTEHLVLEQGRKRNVRMIPLHTVSEITLKEKSASMRSGSDAFDPSVA